MYSNPIFPVTDLLRGLGLNFFSLVFCCLVYIPLFLSQNSKKSGPSINQSLDHDLSISTNMRSCLIPIF